MAQQTVKNFYLFTKPYLELLKMKALPRARENVYLQNVTPQLHTRISLLT